MAVVTFMSDFGLEDHYVAAVKAAIIREDPTIRIVDISHHIQASDIGHAAYVLKHAYHEFPEGTVHLCAIDISSREKSRAVAVKMANHFFVGMDCGLFSLISQTSPSEIIEIPQPGDIQSTFEAKDILAPVAAKLAKSGNTKGLGQPLSELKTLFPRQLKVTKREIVGNVIRVDHYGNLITNITKKEFETIVNLNGQKGYEICFGRERSPAYHNSYHEVDSGEYFIIFNSSQLLQIGINKGNASELLGLGPDSPVIINFLT